MQLIECIACQYGFHDEHTEVIERALEGMMGGSMCPCKGECRDRPSRSDEFALVRDYVEQEPSGRRWHLIDGDPGDPYNVAAARWPCTVHHGTGPPVFNGVVMPVADHEQVVRELREALKREREAPWLTGEQLDPGME